jgi:hypothetical protein
LFGTLAIVFSGIGLSQIKKDPSRFSGKGLAIAGLVIGIVDIIVFLALISMA